MQMLHKGEERQRKEDGSSSFLKERRERGKLERSLVNSSGVQ